MRLRDAARYFDRNPAYDGYTGVFAFNCVYSNFDETKGDGSTNRRRSLGTDPSVVIPARHCVLLGAQRWLVGDATDESFQGTITRHSYNVKRVTNLLTILTPAQACLASAGVDAYGQLFYMKDTVNVASDAEYDTFWNVLFAKIEPASKNAFLRDESGVLYHVRNCYTVPEGYKIAETDQLDAGALQTGVVFNTGAYNAITDTYSVGSVTTNVVQCDPTKFYRFDVRPEADLKPGDRMVFVAASALTPAPGMTFTMFGKKWQVVLAKPEQDAYALLARLA